MTDNLNYSDASKISHVSFTRTARSDSLMREVLTPTLGTLRLYNGNDEDEGCVNSLLCNFAFIHCVCRY